MNLDQIPFFSMLKNKLGYVNERQKLISQNVANADTPGYAPGDLKPFTFEQAMRLPLASAGASAAEGVAQSRTNPSHLAGPEPTRSQWKSVDAPDSEARLDGNQVVLEDQMIKMNQARMDYDAAIGFYQQSLSMIRLAARKPGG